MSENCSSTLQPYVPTAADRRQQTIYSAMDLIKVAGPGCADLVNLIAAADAIAAYIESGTKPKPDIAGSESGS